MKQCLLCGSKKMVKSVITENLKYKDLEKSIENVVTFQCENCGESFYDKKSDRVLDKEFADLRRRKEGLLSSKEIKNFRKQYGFTQKYLSKIIGMSPKTITRYENGTVIQSNPVDKLLRLLIYKNENIQHLIPNSELLNDYKKFSPDLLEIEEGKDEDKACKDAA